MLRVVYETRSLDGTASKPVCCSELIPVHEIDAKASKIRGIPVKIIEVSKHRENKTIKTTTAMRSSKRRDFSDLKHLLNRFYRRSAWKQSVALVIDDFIKALEWEEVLKEAGGFPIIPFSHHWHQFKKQYDHELRWSPATVKMFSRLEQQDWLLPYMDKEIKT